MATKSLKKIKNALLANEYVFFFMVNHARGKTSRQSKSPKIIADPRLIKFLEKECGWSLVTISYHNKAEIIRVK